MENKHTVLGVALGFAVAFTVIFGGLPGLLWAVLFVAIFGTLGAHLDHTIDLGELINRLGGKG